MIIEVVVHAVTALVIAHFRGRHSTEISVVIVAEHERHAFKFRIALKSRRLLVTIEIRLDFLIEREHSRHLVEVLVDVLFDQAVLRFQDFSQKIDVVLKRRFLAHDGRVRLAAHADGDDVFKLAASDQAVFPELRDALLIRKKIPGVAVDRSRSAQVSVLLALAQTRFVMGHAHDDTKFVREFRARKSRTVVREDRRPHRRPHVVALEAQKQFENVLVAFRVKSAEPLITPISECRPLVIDEESAEPYRRLLGDEFVFSGDRKLRFSFGLYVQPVDER